MPAPQWIAYATKFAQQFHRNGSPETVEDATQTALTYCVKRGATDSWLTEVSEDGRQVGKARIRGMVRSAILDWRRNNGTLHLPLRVPSSKWKEFTEGGGLVVLSLEEPCHEGGEPLQAVLPARAEPTEDLDWEKELKLLQARLTPQELLVLKYLMEGMSQEDIGRLMDVTGSRICQVWIAIQKKATDKSVVSKVKARGRPLDLSDPTLGTNRLKNAREGTRCWRASVWFKGKHVSLGYYRTQEEAHEAYVRFHVNNKSGEVSSD